MIAIVTFKALTPGVYPNERVLKLTSDEQSLPIGRASKSISKGLQSAKDNAWFDSPVMSREHAEITFDSSSTVSAGESMLKDPLTDSQQHVMIRDMQSMHGTRLNGAELDPFENTILNNGDCLLFGAEVRRGSEVFPACCFKVTYEFSPRSAHESQIIRRQRTSPLTHILSRPLSINTIKFPETSDAEEDDEDYESEEDLDDDDEDDIMESHGNSTPRGAISVDSLESTSERGASELFESELEILDNHGNAGDDANTTHVYVVPDSPITYPILIAESEDESDEEHGMIGMEEDEDEGSEGDESSQIEGIGYPYEETSAASSAGDHSVRYSIDLRSDDGQDDDADVIITGSSRISHAVPTDLEKSPIFPTDLDDWCSQQVHDLDMEHTQDSKLSSASNSVLSAEKLIIIPDDEASNSQDIPVMTIPRFDSEQKTATESSQAPRRPDIMEYDTGIPSSSRLPIFGFFVDREPSPSDAAMVKTTSPLPAPISTFSAARPNINTIVVNPNLVHCGAPITDLNASSLADNVRGGKPVIDSRREFLEMRRIQRPGTDSQPRSMASLCTLGPTHTPAWTSCPTSIGLVTDDYSQHYAPSSLGESSFLPPNILQPTALDPLAPASPSNASFIPQEHQPVTPFSEVRSYARSNLSTPYDKAPAESSSTGRVAVTINDIISTTPKEFDIPLTSIQAKKRKSDEISDVLEEEMLVWASESPGTEEAEVNTPVFSSTAAGAITAKEVAKAEPPNKRIKRFAEAVGYAALGGVAVGAGLFSILVATAPDFV
jgi:pSer/pThr/pTyr-binding forkhead associated (FHA) protein